MNCCQTPDLGSMCRLDCCQACDMFPVDMGIDVGPLQARINECKRRYHREVWQILCDGANQQSRRGKYAGNDDVGDDDDDDDQESVDGRDQRRRGGKRGTAGGTPGTSTEQTSTNARPAGGRKERNQSRRGRRDKRSVSIGGVSVSGEVGWTPIEAQLNELKTTLARAYRNGCSSKKKKKTSAAASTASAASGTKSATKTVSKSATKTVSTSTTKTVTTATPSAIKTATATDATGSSESRNRQARTLEFTLIADPSKPELSISGGSSFRTVTDTDASFVPLHCGDWGGARQPRTAATTATATSTASSRRQLRSHRRRRGDSRTRPTASKEASGCSRS